MSNGENPSTQNAPPRDFAPLDSGQDHRSESHPLEKWGRNLVLGALFVAFIASCIVYPRRKVDLGAYVAVGTAFFDGRDIYLDTPVGTNTWPPFFSMAAVPLALLDRVSPFLPRIIWVVLTWASILWALDVIARMIYGKRLRFRPEQNSLTISSPEILVPFALALPYILTNFEMLQIDMILFALVLWGLFLQATGREAAGGIALAAAASLKVMAFAFLPYLLYRKRWRVAFWMASSSLILFLTPALILGWGKFWRGVALWPATLHATLGAGNGHQSVYSMWDRILGYGYIPFTVPGQFMLPLSGSHSARIAWEITCVIVGALGAIACRGIPSPNSRTAHVEWALIFVAGAVLSPLMWKHYLVVLLLPYALLYAAWQSSEIDLHLRRVLRNVMFASFALSVPTLHDLIGRSLAIRLEMGSVVTYSALVMLGGLLRYRSRAPREAM